MTAATEGQGVPSATGQGTLLERLSAVLALSSLAAALVCLFVGAAANWQGLVLAFFGLLLLVGAGWHVMSRRGSTRALALLMALAALGLLIAGFVVADLSGRKVAAVAVLAALSMASARFALRGVRAHQHRSRAGQPVPPARHPVLIMNPKSGGGKVERFQLADECRRRGIEAIVLRPGDDLAGLAEQAIQRGADVIGMAGGDGSQALVATVAMRHGIPHVCVPAGTRNHFALDLGLDRDDVVGALDGYGAGVEHRVDLAAVNGRVFVNNASLGLYAKIVQSPQYRAAKRQTAAAMLPELVGKDATPLDLRFTGPDGTEQSTAQIILVSNNPYQLHRFGGRGTRERLDCGVLGVMAVQIANSRAAVASWLWNRRASCDTSPDGSNGAPRTSGSTPVSRWRSAWTVRLCSSPHPSSSNPWPRPCGCAYRPTPPVSPLRLAPYIWCLLLPSLRSWPWPSLARSESVRPEVAPTKEEGWSI